MWKIFLLLREESLLTERNNKKGGEQEHADPRELPNQLTSNSGTNFYIAS